MAKAGIITFLHNTNYGSLLQAFALEKVLETLNVEELVELPIEMRALPEVGIAR